VAAWSIWGQDLFPKEEDPTGGMLPYVVLLTLLKEVADPEKWTREELRRWLAAVSPINILAPIRPL